MSNLTACRICLQTDSKFYSLDQYNLKNYYELISGISISEQYNFPPFFCVDCATLLHRFNTFRNKCHYTNEVLQNLVWNYSISYKSITDIVIQNHPILQQGKLTLSEGENTDIAGIKLEANDSSDFETLDTTDINDTDPVADEDDIPLKPPTTNTDKIITETNTVEVLIESSTPDSKDSYKFSVEVIKEEPKLKSRSKAKRKAQSIQTKKKAPPASKKKASSAPKKRSPPGPKKTSSDAGKPKTPPEILNSSNWKISRFEEDEALENFQAKALSKQYLNAPFKCEDCYKGFSQRNMLERHIPQRHGEKLGNLTCKFCRMRFRYISNLNKHIQRHYMKYECQQCDLVLNLESSAVYHEEYHKGKVRKCEYCDQEFKHISTYYTHLRTHRSKHMCTLCGESFVSELGLLMHTKAKHSTATTKDAGQSTQSTYCDVCQIKFETNKAYEIHLQHSAMHVDKDFDAFPGVPVVVPEECADDVKSEPEVKRKPPPKAISVVRKHKYAVTLGKDQKRPNKKPTTCHQCGEHFASQTACMKHHLSAHPRTSFFAPCDRIVCEICGASIAPGSVTAHLNRHTRSKMYTCSTCGRSFTNSTMLKNHLVTHTGEKRFACNLCEKRFTQSASLNLHYKTFHLKQPYPKRNRNKKGENPNVDTSIFNGQEE